MDKSQRGSSGWNQGDRDEDSGKPQYAAKPISTKNANKDASKILTKAFRKHLSEAKRATPCGRCGTTHIPPSKGGTCPALKEEVDYDRHFSRQSKEVQTKINHHLRQGADYPTAARKAGATAIKVGKLDERVGVARRVLSSPSVVGGATSLTATAIDRSRPFGERDYRNLTGGSGETAATAAVAQPLNRGIQTRLARPMPANPTLAARAGRVGLRGAGRVAGAVASKLAWPIALGMAGYDAYRGYNAQPNAPITTRLGNMGRNVASGFTAGLIAPPPGINESTTHGNGNMKTLTQFMAEANSYVEIEEELSPEVQAIFDVINEAVGDRELSEEEFNEIYNYIVENLEAELEEAHDIELKPHPNKKGTHFLVHKVNDRSIGSDQLKTGETVNDTHVDDLKDMGYSVKIHND